MSIASATVATAIGIAPVNCVWPVIFFGHGVLRSASAALARAGRSTGRHLRTMAIRKVTVVRSPVLTGIQEIGGVGFLNFDSRQPESHFRDFTEHSPCQILHTGGAVDYLESQLLSGRPAIFLQGVEQGVVAVDQHPVIVLLPEPRFDFVIEVAKQSADITITVHLKMQLQPVAMSVDVAALVPQRFIAMGRIELVMFFDDHGWLPGRTEYGPLFYGIVSSA